ncbi:MAG: hypothetical protein P8165_18095 [Deltaproteobacteria bacterium]|jgi:hypothetical protein
MKQAFVKASFRNVANWQKGASSKKKRSNYRQPASSMAAQTGKDKKMGAIG